jgi:hydroxylamine reductase (hybrid-cluster protein)
MNSTPLQCGFGLLGICCIDCIQGPCRIDPFQKNVQKGECEESVTSIVFKNLLKRLSIGTAISTNYGYQLISHLLTCTDLDKKDKKLISSASEDYSRYESIPCNWLKPNLTPQRFELLSKSQVLPYNINNTIIEALTLETDDINELFLRSIKCSIVNFNTLNLISDLTKIAHKYNKSIPQWCLRVNKNISPSKLSWTSLMRKIRVGKILGIAFWVGCRRLNPKAIEIINEFKDNSILSILIGCQDEDGLLSIGSCIEVVKVINFATKLATIFETDIDSIPIIVIISAQIDRRIEVMAYWMMALGILVYWEKIPPIMGSPMVVEFYTQIIKKRFRGYSIWNKEVKELIEILKRYKINLK